MRLKVIERMFRDQYSLTDSDTVEVSHVYTQGDESQYLIKDINTVDGVTTERVTTIVFIVSQKDPIVLDIEPDCKCTRCHKRFSSKTVQKKAVPTYIKALNVGAPTSLPVCPHCEHMYFFKLPKIEKDHKDIDKSEVPAKCPYCNHDHIYFSEPDDSGNKHLLWGTRGKTLTSELRWVKLIDCSTEHLENILKTQPQINREYTTAINNILNSRK